MPERRFLAILAVAWLATALIAFRHILTVGFLGDDWMFLDLVSRAPNVLVVFAPLNLRYTRPLIVLVYYLNFHVFGLWPVPAHVIVVLLHAFNAWLVSLLVLRLAPPPNRVMAAGAGLVFLLFAGHSEAVAWVAGMADAAVVPFIAGSLLLFDRALRDARPARWIAAGWIVAAAGFLAKETAFVVPALAVCYGVLSVHRMEARARLARTAAFAGGTALIAAVYFALRAARFGSPLGVMAGMGTSEGQRLDVARMFLLRLFVPPGGRAAALWVHDLDIVLLAAVIAAAILVAVLDRRDRAGLAFTGAALLVSIAPALPFSISLVSTLTERYIYLATVFSCILAAWIATRLARPPILAGLVLAFVAGAQWHYLGRSNATWIREDEIFHSVVSGVASLAGRHEMGASTILLLNMPDAIGRACVDAAGVPVALRLSQSRMDDVNAQLRIVALHDVRAWPPAVHVNRKGREFIVNVDGDALVNDCRPGVPEYVFAERSADSFAVRLLPMARRAIVAYVTDGGVREAGVIDGIPFGFVDLPGGDAECESATLRMAGWALDDSAGLDVRVEQEAGGSWTTIGRPQWQRGTRPDVVALYPGYPDAGRAAWEFMLPCTAIGRPATSTRVRVVARDSAGQEAELGTRTIRRQ